MTNMPEMLRAVAVFLRKHGVQCESDTTGGETRFHLPDFRLVLALDGSTVFATYTRRLPSTKWTPDKSMEQLTYFRVDLVQPDSFDVILEKVRAFKHPERTVL